MKRTEKYFKRKAEQVLNALFGKCNLVLLTGDTVLCGKVVSELKAKSSLERKVKTPKQNTKTIYNHRSELIFEYDIEHPKFSDCKSVEVVFIERADYTYRDGDINIALDALKDKDIKVVLTSNKSRKEIAYLLKNRPMKTIEVNYLENKASKRTAANKEAIEAFDAVEMFSDEIPFPEVEKSKEIEETGGDVESFLEDLITAPFKSEIVDLKEELYSVEYKLKNTKIALESSDELLRNANKMIDRLKNEVYNLSMDCSKLIVQKDELQERNQILKQELEETAEISGLGDALLDEAKSLIDKLESDNNGLNDEVKAQQLYIESLENDKRTLLDDYEYISLDNLTLQSEIISLKRNLEEHDNKVANLFAELNSILKKNK
ncbi:TPA: hypothetical protein ACGUC9_004408 [Salmonella enterica]|uniref:hypothetical protein n=1 Tax=Serratia marcescens TaxID=615 RepID=UPI000FA9617C|nr:hypothetical protein [Serratia marcescens]EDQ7726110.1 hypothetical protein [Salmonella enterica subsp. enterica serovar Braenderup]HAF0365956.1 hypothetical protein [Salmonella enterica subsp. enterica serovar Dublin]EDV0588556.1 hypothetical protein [Salmonella enterica subsp. enterica serovar Braenderup]EEP8078307.1 hypothetical protein [Salmonella enterica subsp. enterica serovar Braenderup]MJM01381.1 hypothetical protein [Salmonella enterica subsp. enterica serovar Braenderup]